MLLIKKYANRRLYNTETSSYITLEAIYSIIRENREFKVIDAKTKEDITRLILTQIIFERENRNHDNILPSSFLKFLIQIYDENLQNIFTHYLESMMNNFNGYQQIMIQESKKYFHNLDYLKAFENISKSNMEFLKANFINFPNKNHD